MGSKKLRRVGLSQELCDRLSRHQIVTCRDFLCLSPLELMKMTGLSYRGVHELLCMVSRACAPQMQTAYGIKTQRSAALSPAFLPTTLSALDEALHGGVACGSLTEITGPPGCGKTQFCIMMSILATLPIDMGGLEGAVVYIDTEAAFSAERLVEIAESRFPSYFNNEDKLLLTSSNVHLYRELSCDEVLQRVESLEEEIISKGVKLVIIDSVASVVRKEFDTQLQGNMRERNKFLAREAASLKYLAEEFSIPHGFCQAVPCPRLASELVNTGPRRSRMCKLNCCATGPAQNNSILSAVLLAAMCLVFPYRPLFILAVDVLPFHLSLSKFYSSFTSELASSVSSQRFVYHSVLA
uniref:RAD51 paralog B n=1 Tax=Equus caballus TaxID=9796 RepID=F7ATV5_HORSE